MVLLVSIQVSDGVVNPVPRAALLQGLSIVTLSPDSIGTKGLKWLSAGLDQVVVQCF